MQARTGVWGEDFPAFQWSGDGSTASSRQLAGDSTEGIGNLMPITQRSAITPAAHSSFNRLANTGAAEQGLTPSEPPFRRRIGALRSPHSNRSHRARTRAAQLVQEPVQEDSPKGLDRALTPSMLKAVKHSGDKGDSAKKETLVAPKSSGVTLIYLVLCLMLLCRILVQHAACCFRGCVAVSKILPFQVCVDPC